MKMKFINIKFIITIFLFFLAACESKQSQRWNWDKDLALIDAQSAGMQVGVDYLQCYPLSGDAKDVCLNDVSGKHIKPKYRKNLAYIRVFQHENEKAGFIRMLRAHGAKCDVIEKGPEFVQQTKSYVANCRNGNVYLINFNHSYKEWEFIK